MSKSILYSIFKPTFGYAFALTLLAGSLSAHATPQNSSKTYTDSFSANSAGSFTLPDFSTTQGSLDSITITLSINIPATANAPTTTTNVPFTDLPQNLTKLTLGSGHVPNTSNTITSFIRSSGPNSVTTGNTGSTPTNTGTTTDHGGPVNKSSTSKTITENLTPSQFATFENQNGGNVDLNFADGNVFFGGSNFGNGAFLGLTGNEEISVKYAFTPQAAPEPSGKYLAALAAGVAALLLLRRKIAAA
jgi:hypothetical protein